MVFRVFVGGFVPGLKPRPTGPQCPVPDGWRYLNSQVSKARRGAPGETGHHVGVEEEGLEGAEGVGEAASLLDDVFVGALGVDVPLPGVFKGVDLRTGLGAVFLGEEDVVVLAGVEGRVEIDEIDGLVLHITLEDFKIVAVIELVFIVGHGIG